jgi:hypothetical protein
MKDTSFSPSLLELTREQLQLAREQAAAATAASKAGTPFYVPEAGKHISSAYEQLRNAAEYAEDHLLLQHAVRRFYKRSLSFGNERDEKGTAEELLVELTQSGYLKNGVFGTALVGALDATIAAYMQQFWLLRSHKVSKDEATAWILDLLSVETERTLNPDYYVNALAYIAYTHYLELLPRKAFLTSKRDETAYETCLYIAVHQALLKSDLAVIRHSLLREHTATVSSDLSAFIVLNRTITGLHAAALTHRLKQAVNRYGAPLRVLIALTHENHAVPELLANKEAFLDAFAHQTAKEYQTIRRRLTKGIVRSIIFIFITKVLIGLLVEIPYDLLVEKHIVLLPLIINLAFPPLYMASLKLGLYTPSIANAEALKDYIEKILFTRERPLMPAVRAANAKRPLLISMLVGITYLVPFSLTVYVLSLLQFNIVQGVIFFVFLSTATFLGFRLSRIVREMEIITKQQNLLTTARDFFYLPFILVGQWVSSKYARLNVVAKVLDVAIELPLKTFLRLVRQWTRFLHEKHDEIY